MEKVVFGGIGWILVGLVEIRWYKLGFRWHNVGLSGMRWNSVGYVRIGWDMLGLGGIGGF